MTVMNDREGRDLLIRISVQLEQLSTQVTGLGERFIKLETQVQDVNQRGLLQQTAIERNAERTKALEDKIAGDEGLDERVQGLEQEILVRKTQFRTMVLLLTPVYGLALVQVGKWVTAMLWGSP
jgi:predicted  nucleic acid-binding Zn-ribbon protein